MSPGLKPRAPPDTAMQIGQAKIACALCAMFNPHPDSPTQSGWCKRYPPTAFTVPARVQSGAGAMSIQSSFTPVAAAEWCGEYVPRPVIPEAANG